MTGIGSQFGQFGQSGGGISPYGYGALPIANPFLPQTPQHLQSLQQLPFGYGQQQGFAQPLQQLMQILPQQLWHINQLLQHHVHGLQQLVQVVPQQLQQIQQVLQTLPQQIQQLQAQQQPFGAQVIPFIPWQQPGVSMGAPGFTGQAGSVM